MAGPDRGPGSGRVLGPLPGPNSAKNSGLRCSGLGYVKTHWGFGERGGREGEREREEGGCGGGREGGRAEG